MEPQYSPKAVQTDTALGERIQGTSSSTNLSLPPNLAF